MVLSAGSIDCPRTCFTQAGLKLLIPLPPPSECWDSRKTPPCPTDLSFDTRYDLLTKNGVSDVTSNQAVLRVRGGLSEAASRELSDQKPDTTATATATGTGVHALTGICFSNTLSSQLIIADPKVSIQIWRRQVPAAEGASAGRQTHLPALRPEASGCYSKRPSPSCRCTSYPPHSCTQLQTPSAQESKSLLAQHLGNFPLPGRVLCAWMGGNTEDSSTGLLGFVHARQACSHLAWGFHLRNALSSCWSHSSSSAAAAQSPSAGTSTEDRGDYRCYSPGSVCKCPLTCVCVPKYTPVPASPRPPTHEVPLPLRHCGATLTGHGCRVRSRLVLSPPYVPLLFLTLAPRETGLIYWEGHKHGRSLEAHVHRWHEPNMRDLTFSPHCGKGKESEVPYKPHAKTHLFIHQEANRNSHEGKP